MAMICLKCREFIHSSTNSHYGLHASCFKAWFEVKKKFDFSDIQRRSSSTNSLPTEHQDLVDNSFFHGKFKKYSAKLNGQNYILKMRHEDAPELPEVEYLCNQIGKLVDIPVAKFYYINFNGDNTFVTKNFIQTESPNDLQHIYHFRHRSEHSCEGIMRIIAEKTQRPYDVSILIKTILYDALIGNHDRHGRNLALIVKANATVLSPIYDNVSYLSLEKGGMLMADFNPTGKICTLTSLEPSMRDYVIELKRLGYTSEVEKFFDNVDLEKIIQLISKSFCSDAMKNAITKLIKKRFLELENEL